MRMLGVDRRIEDRLWLWEAWEGSCLVSYFIEVLCWHELMELNCMSLLQRCTCNKKSSHPSYDLRIANNTMKWTSPLWRRQFFDSHWE